MMRDIRGDFAKWMDGRAASARMSAAQMRDDAAQFSHLKQGADFLNMGEELEALATKWDMDAARVRSGEIDPDEFVQGMRGFQALSAEQFLDAYENA